MVWRFIFLFVIAGVAFFASAEVNAQEAGDRFVTVYDRGEKRSFMSREKTVGAALEAQGIKTSTFDAVEPSLDEEMVASDYKVNIYRARLVTVVDGQVRMRVLTPYQSVAQIVKSAAITLYPEDITTLSRSVDYINGGAGIVLTIDRAVDFTLDLYGKRQTVRTHARTIGDMLREKDITIGDRDRVSVAMGESVYQGMLVRVWREGKQTVTEDVPTGFTTEFVYDADRPVGYREIKTAGTPGVHAVTYEIEIREGSEVSRKQIARIAVSQPKPQQVLIGIKGLENGLTRNRGALHSTDSRGVVHRETYYDLDMGVVMNSCGKGGRYTVRFDGMKIDDEGYILVAANYAKYPKCSIVETSAGLGRVYDTGGFVLRHPDGFDLATDWTNNNGR